MTAASAPEAVGPEPFAAVIARMVAASTAASGVPERLEDPIVARRVADALAAPAGTR